MSPGDGDALNVAGAIAPAVPDDISLGASMALECTTRSEVQPYTGNEVNDDRIEDGGGNASDSDDMDGIGEGDSLLGACHYAR